MKIAIRTDASSTIGAGHLMRCLALAGELKKVGAEVLFLTSAKEHKWISLIRENDYAWNSLAERSGIEHSKVAMGVSEPDLSAKENAMAWEEDVVRSRNALRDRNVDWIIVDHYGLDRRWESAMRPFTERVAVIDDLADRRHDCDLLVDCVYGRSDKDYQDLVPQNCMLLLGTEFALLRPDFLKWRRFALDRRRNIKSIRNILVSLGGVDRKNLTGQVLEQLMRIEWSAEIEKIEISVVLGLGFAHRKIVEDQCASMPMKITLDVNVNNMAERIANADLGVGALGVSTWERYCLGLPSVNLITERNQIEVVDSLRKIPNSGIMHERSVTGDLVPFLEQFVHDRLIRRKFVDCFSQMVDGKGVQRLVRQLERIR